MGKVKRGFYKVAAVVAGVVMTAGNALATTSTFSVAIPSSIDVTPVGTFAGVILTAIGTIWVIKKLIKTGNRS